MLKKVVEVWRRLRKFEESLEKVEKSCGSLENVGEV